MNDETLATEMLHELKASAKRWFIIAVIELFIILGITGAFIWYISLPVEECTEVYNEDGNANYIGNDLNGELSNGKN